jgi:DNA-directed RNA polymerase specialized sigma24 family protein
MRLSRTAFERLLIEFLAEIYRTARVYVRRDQDAEDLVHEACVWALDRFDARAFPGPGACRQWLHQILLNVFRDSYRCAGRSPISDVTSLDNVVELIPSSGPGP